MMKSNALLLAAALIVSASTAHARQTPSTSPPTTAAAEVTQCAQAQMVVDGLLSRANTRLEAARQTNSAGDMRAAVDELQTTLRDVRAQLAPCANVQPATDAHAGHAMPNVQQSPAAPGTPAMAPAAKPPAGAVDPHAGHVMPAAPAKPAPTAKPAPGAQPPSAAKPPAASPPMDHSKMNMGIAAKPAAGAKPTPGAKAPASPAVDHSKMDMGTATKPAPAKGGKPAPGTKPPASPAPMDHSKMDMGTSAKPAPGASAQATDPVCGLKVAPATAPSTKHNGQTYYFCSQQHQQLFQKNPAKFLPKQQ